MKLLKQIVLTLPVLRNSQACEACGETFVCEISLAKGCWCGEIKLSDETRQELRAKYKNVCAVPAWKRCRFKLTIGGEDI
jgi:hypothetical protein